MKSSNQNRRVVITGLGVVSSLGIGHKEFWKNLIAGKSGISKVTTFDTSKYERHYAGEIKNFDPEKFINRRKVAQMGRTSYLAIAATKLALKDAGIKSSDIRRNNLGVSIGTTMGEAQVIEQIVKHTLVNQESILRNRVFLYPASVISSTVANYFKLTGFNTVFANACAAGNYSIGQVFDQIKSGNAEMAFGGGSDAFSRIAFTGFGRLFAMSPDKCRPFDKNRKGMMLGEGAGILLLETLKSAQKRKAKIYAEVMGYGLSCDAKHMTNPSVTGIAHAMKKALNNSNATYHGVDYICAHGTGTPENDRSETEAIKRIFGENAKKIPVSSIKSMLGHTMGAASALESIACCLAINNNQIPPTINLKDKDPECDLDYVPNKGRKAEVEVAINNSSAFGGNNCCLVLRKIN